MKILAPFSRPKQDTEAAYLLHRQQHRFLNILGSGIQQLTQEHAQTIAKANLQAGKEISKSLDQGFQEVRKGQIQIHDALVDQTQVIQSGFDAVEFRLAAGFDQVAGGLNEVANRVDQVGAVIVETGERLFTGLAGIKASVDMGMVNVITQFELQRQEIQTGFEQLSDLLENNRKTEAQERYRDGATEYERYLQHPDEPQFLVDSLEYLQESVRIYRGNPFCHLYLGHIYQEPAQYFDLEKAQEHYRLCATYAKGLHNEMLAALGYFLAAWISYVRGDHREAIRLGEQSLEFDKEKIPENYYNLAKYHARAGNEDQSIEYLNTAIQQFDPFYSLKANMDADFEALRERLNSYFSKIRDEEAHLLAHKLSAFGIDSFLLEGDSDPQNPE